MANDERHDRKSRRVWIAEDQEIGIRAPARDRAADERLLASRDLVRADRILELKHEPSPYRLEDRGRAAFFAVFDVADVAMLCRVHVRDRSATRNRRNFVREEPALRDEHAGRTRAADELVRRKKDGVFVGEVSVGDVAVKIHLDRYVGPGRGEVPKRKSAKAVQKRRDCARIGADSRDVRRSRKATDEQPTISMSDELRLEGVDTDVRRRLRR